jgi:SAM-dependent methyltransferase
MSGRAPKKKDLAFDSAERLALWRATGRFPNIHDALYALIRENLEGRRVLDLCCSTGLLGERIRVGCRAAACGLDADREALDRGTEAGISYPRLAVTLGRATLPAVVAWLARRKVDTVVARRCLSELCAHDPGFGPVLAAAFADLGVRELFIQGRQKMSTATHPIPDVDAEIRLVDGPYRVVEKRGECAYLRTRSLS